MRVGVVGYGAVGSVVADALAEGAQAGLELGGVHAWSTVPVHLRAPDFERLLAASDLVVEAASQEAVAQYGPATLRAGRHLVVVSVGALRDDALLAELRALAEAGPGRLLVTTGAIGGVDLLRAAAGYGPLTAVSLTTVKPSSALVRPWMDDALVTVLTAGDTPVEVFHGPARLAVDRFPESVNVAATLSLVTLGFDRVEVRIVGDPAAQDVRHTIRADGAAGSWELSLRNVASPSNPRTSALTPHAVLRGLADLRAPVVIGL